MNIFQSSLFGGTDPQKWEIGENIPLPDCPPEGPEAVTEVRQINVVINGTRYITGITCQPMGRKEILSENLSEIFDKVANPVRNLFE